MIVYIQIKNWWPIKNVKTLNFAPRRPHCNSNAPTLKFSNQHWIALNCTSIKLKTRYFDLNSIWLSIWNCFFCLFMVTVSTGVRWKSLPSGIVALFVHQQCAKCGCCCPKFSKRNGQHGNQVSIIWINSGANLIGNVSTEQTATKLLQSTTLIHNFLTKMNRIQQSSKLLTN